MPSISSLFSSFRAIQYISYKLLTFAGARVFLHYHGVLKDVAVELILLLIHFLSLCEDALVVEYRVRDGFLGGALRDLTLARIVFWRFDRLFSFNLNLALFGSGEALAELRVKLDEVVLGQVVSHHMLVLLH